MTFDDLDALDQPRDDDGVPVGDADVEADYERASGKPAPEEDMDDYLADARRAERSDDGTPIGDADAELDDRR